MKPAFIIPPDLIDAARAVVSNPTPDYRDRTRLAAWATLKIVRGQPITEERFARIEGAAA